MNKKGATSHFVTADKAENAACLQIKGLTLSVRAE
jgi:hypothetical protein